MSKGSARRPCMVSREEFDVRWALFMAEIDHDEYNKRMKKIKEKTNARQD